MKEGWLVICWFCQEALGRRCLTKLIGQVWGGGGRGALFVSSSGEMSQFHKEVHN